MAAVDGPGGDAAELRRRLVGGRLPDEVGPVDEVVRRRRRPRGGAVAVRRAAAFPAAAQTGSHVTSGRRRRSRDVLHVVVAEVGLVTLGISRRAAARSSLPDNRIFTCLYSSKFVAHENTEKKFKQESKSTTNVPINDSTTYLADCTAV